MEISFSFNRRKDKIYFAIIKKRSSLHGVCEAGSADLIRFAGAQNESRRQTRGISVCLLAFFRLPRSMEMKKRRKGNEDGRRYSNGRTEYNHSEAGTPCTYSWILVTVFKYWPVSYKLKIRRHHAVCHFVVLLRALTKPAPGEERAAVWLCLTACQDFQTAGKPGVLRGDSLSLSPKLHVLLNNSKF